MESQKNIPNIELTAIFVRDTGGGYSAFFAQFPEAIAQGSDENTALRNLIDVFSIMLKDKKEENEHNIQDSGVSYTTKSVNVNMALA